MNTAYNASCNVCRLELYLRCWCPAGPPRVAGCTRLQLSGCPLCWASGLVSSVEPCASGARTWCSNSWSARDRSCFTSDPMLYRQQVACQMLSPKRKMLQSKLFWPYLAQSVSVYFYTYETFRGGRGAKCCVYWQWGWGKKTLYWTLQYWLQNIHC